MRITALQVLRISFATAAMEMAIAIAAAVAKEKGDEKFSVLPCVAIASLTS